MSNLKATGIVAFVVLFLLAGVFATSNDPASTQVQSRFEPIATASALVEDEPPHGGDSTTEDQPLPVINPPTDSLQGEAARATRFGDIEVVEVDGFEKTLHFQGIPIDVRESYLELGAIFQFGDKDLLLVAGGSGGTACPAQFTLLVASADGLSMSKPFGDCSDLVRVVERADRLVVRVGREAFYVTPKGVEPVAINDAYGEEVKAEAAHPNGDVLFVLQPLVTADMKMYRWCGILESAQDGSFIVALGDPQYKFAAVSSEPEHWQGLPLRIGGPICITGRYVSNYEAETVLGVPKTLPMLAVFAVSM